MAHSFHENKEPMDAPGRKRPRVVRALGICSGGLDSILSALVLRQQGIDVAWVNFETPFFGSDKARQAARMTGVPLTVKDITDTYITMLKNPHCGYGGNMNPCLDCHALMFRLAADIMREQGLDFLFSGEVLGQRPMSQTKPSLRYVEKHSGADGYIVRPLSAKRLPESIPEKQGLVDREQLLGISGRGRKQQIALAEAFGVTDYPAPAGGCLLTDKGFSRRLKDLFSHQGDHEKREFELLKHGRHFRVPGGKVIVGRTKADNEHIAALTDPQKDISLRMADMPSPMVLIPNGASGPSSQSLVQQAAALCAAYSKAKEGDRVRVAVTSPKGPEILMVSTPARRTFESCLL